MSDWIFLDNHSHTSPSKELIKQFAKEIEQNWLIGPIEKVKQEIGDLLGKGSFYLTSSHGEGNFHLLLSHYMDYIRETGRTHILTCETESPNILQGIKRLEKFEVQGKILPVNSQGQLTEETLQEAIRARSSLLSISLAHPLTGVVQPIADLSDLCRQHDIQIHLDVSSAIGKFYFANLDVDYLTFDGRLFHCPGMVGGLLAKEKISPLHFNEIKPPYAYFSILKKGLELAQEKIDHYAMEVGRLRDLLEKQLSSLGGQLFFQDVDRLSNCTVVAFEGIHSEILLKRLKKQGVYATTGYGRLAEVLKCCQIDPQLAHCAISMVLSDETTEEEINRLIPIISKEIEEIRSKQFKKPFNKEDAKQKNMRLCHGETGEKNQGAYAALSMLIDEDDGVIADCRWEAFGPPSLLDTAEATSTLLLRKNYMQARRLSADLIEKKMKDPDGTYVNLLIDAIDTATERCLDIPIEDIYVAPPEMEGGERREYPNWEGLTNAQKKKVILEVMDQDIRPYVELDAGGVDVVKVEENRITIAYKGNCTSCFSATGATLDAIGNILRHKIYPDLMVIPDMSLLQQ